MKEYRDSPREIDTLQPFCFHEEDTLVIAFPSPNCANGEHIRITTCNTKPEREHWIIRLEEKKERLITLHDGNTSLTAAGDHYPPAAQRGV